MAQSAPEPLDPNFQLRLPSFEGPLDLLLHLTQKHELDILDLPIAFVTERYLEYIELMERLDLDVASEYLVMAATLAHIKSRMLLPPDPDALADEAEDGEEAIDPRAELIRRLLEYQKYKHAAENLMARGVAGRDVFLRGIEAPEATGPAPLASLGLFKLLDAFQAILKRTNKDLAFQITTEGVSIQERMTELAERLKARRRCTFEELFDDVHTVYDVVITFMAMLEMAKRRLTRIYQADVLAPIHIEYLVIGLDEELVETSDDSAIARPGEDPLGEAALEDDADETDADETDADETDADETDADETDADETDADETDAGRGGPDHADVAFETTGDQDSGPDPTDEGQE